MAKLRISVPSEKFEMTATLLEDEAPKTCKAIKSILPVEGPLNHAIQSGQDMNVHLKGPKQLKLERENLVYSTVPGDILYLYTWWGDENRYVRGSKEISELILVYGRNHKLHDASLEKLTGGNLFASIDSKLDQFAAICEKVREKGVMTVRIEAL